MFDNLLTLSAPKKDLLDNELAQYLAAPTEHDDNPFLWWHERCAIYPHLSQMACNYLSIPGFYFLLIILIHSNLCQC